MGGFVTKQWFALGYYSDLVDGYISRAGGSPHMIRFPRELQSLPMYCQNCNSSAGLLIEETRRRLEAEREHFRNRTEKIISDRFTKGERQPYPEYNDADAVEGHCHYYLFSLLRFLKRNSIAPQIVNTPNRENTEDPFYYLVDIKDIVVCRCMMDKHFVFETSIEDEDELDTVRRKDYHLGISHAENGQQPTSTLFNTSSLK